jgi:plastocyanin
MSRRLASILATVALLALGLAAAPTVIAGDPCYHGFDVPARSEEAAYQIKVAPCAFAPTVARVAVGATVTFFNGPDFVHLITGANAEWGDRDVELKPGQEVSYRFDKAGIYPYACALHRGMSGAIVVGSVAAPAAAAGPTTPASADGSSGDAGAALPVAVGGGVIVALVGAGLFVARRRQVAA